MRARVGFNRLVADMHFRRNLLRSHALPEELEGFKFAIGQAFNAGCHDLPWPAADSAVKKFFRYFGAEVYLPVQQRCGGHRHRRGGGGARQM
jgi:hypothetical protein